MVALAVNGEVGHDKNFKRLFLFYDDEMAHTNTDFRNHLTTTRGYNPWILLDDLVEKWNPEKFRKFTPAWKNKIKFSTARAAGL